jgi:hypothetical protein
MPHTHQNNPLVAKYRAAHKHNQPEIFPPSQKNAAADAGNQPLALIWPFS